MLRNLLLVSAALVAVPAFAQQTPAFTAAAVDPANPPPVLANEFGPQTWVDDGLTVSTLLDPISTHTNGDAAPDVVGAFRFVCVAATERTDDPMVYPGQSGKSHAHQSYGNTSFNASSTYTSFRTTGESSCINKLNRSGYWQPGLIDRYGNQIRPNAVAVYYKRHPKTSAECAEGNALYIGRCIAIPNAIRFIFGYDMVSGTLPSGNFLWKCVYNSGTNNGTFKNLPDAMDSCKGLPGGIVDLSTKQIAVSITAPSCWDGVNLDSANHRSHVVNLIYDMGGTARAACPKTHPYHFAEFTATSLWSLDSTMDFSPASAWYAGKPGQMSLSSDNMPGMAAVLPGTTVHFDYWEAWNQATKKIWTDNCIDRMLTCVAGDLGNGTTMKQNTTYPVTAIASPRLVKRPKMTKEAVTVHVHAPQ